MKNDKLLHGCMDELTGEEAELLEKMILEENVLKDENTLESTGAHDELNAWKRQENLTMDKIKMEMKATSKVKVAEMAADTTEEDSQKMTLRPRLFGKRRVVLLVATFILMIGMVGFAKEHDWDIKMADRLGFTEVMEELEGGYVKVGVSDTSDNVTITASQLIGDKNCMWVQLDTDVPWTVEEGGCYLFGDENADCYDHKNWAMTGGQTFQSFNNHGYVSFMWQFEDYSDINRATVEMQLNQLVEYIPEKMEGEEPVTDVISEGKWELKWENRYAANTITRYPFKRVTLGDGNNKMACIVREVEVSPISIQIKAWKSPMDGIMHDYELLEAVKLKDGTVIECNSSVGGMGNFTVEAFLSKDYVPELDMTEIEYVVVGGEDIRVAR